MEVRKTPKRREYLNDFKLNEDGKYEYKGILRELDNEELSFKKAMHILMMLDLLILCAFIIAGMVQAVGVMNAMYVTMPYVFGFFAIAVLTFKVFMLEFNHYPIRDYDFKATIAKYKTYSTTIVILTLCTLLGELFYIICYGVTMYVSGTIIFIACMVIALAISLYFSKFNMHLKWKVVEEK